MQVKESGFSMNQDQQGLPRQLFYKEQCKEVEAGRGGQKKRWENNISEWTGLKFVTP